MSGWGLVSVLAMMALSACAGAPKLSDDGRLVRDVTALVGELERAYEHRDAAGLMAGVAPRFAEREVFQQTSEAAFARFDRIDLALTVERVHLEGKTATVYLHWDAQWRAAATNAPIAKQGTARFVVDTDGRVLLAAVLGDDPFTAVPSASP